jgi:branched-chain amino acid transport system permease protein
MTELANYLLLGLGIGAAYALLAMPMSLVLSTSGVLDLPIGGYAVLAALVAASVDPPLGIVLGLVVAATASVAMLFIYRLSEQRLKGSHLTAAVIGLGFLFVLQAIGQQAFGVDPLRIEVLGGSFVVGQLRLSHLSAITMAGAAVLLLAMMLVLYRTSVGRETRAISIDAEAAESMGVPVRRIQWCVFVASGIMAGLAGISYGISVGVGYGDGFGLSLIAFSSVIVLGVAGPGRAVLGGMLIGIVESLAIGYAPTQMSSVVPLIVVLLVLVSGRVRVGELVRA